MSSKSERSSPYEVGNWLLVKAWWLKGAACRCEVRSIWGTDKEYLDVKPMEGNPRARTIKVVDVIEKIHEPNWSISKAE